jgi:DNA-directed RNA polymerase specialized sigma24 family protein
MDSGRRTASAGRRPTPPPDGHAGFDEFYQARHGDVVAMAYALTGDFNEAQDIAQEAFCRAWQRWSALTEHDEPVGWVKRVAINLAISRGRRMNVARRFRLRQQAAVAPPISVDHVALVTEQRRLPPTITRAMVLHYIADFQLEEIADALRTRVGTVSPGSTVAASRSRGGSATPRSTSQRRANDEQPGSRFSRHGPGALPCRPLSMTLADAGKAPSPGTPTNPVSLTMM